MSKVFILIQDRSHACGCQPFKPLRGNMFGKELVLKLAMGTPLRLGRGQTICSHSCMMQKGQDEFWKMQNFTSKNIGN